MSNKPNYYFNTLLSNQIRKFFLFLYMDFGKLPDISKITFTLPPDAPGNDRIWAKCGNTRNKNPKVYVGCPVWANKNWLGGLYPNNAKSRDYLKHYCEQLNTIELNVTHYQIPEEKTIERWKSQASEGFLFAPKVLQEISHRLLPEGQAIPLMKEFCRSIMGLEKYLGTSFLQLGPAFSPEYADKLEDFLAALPHDYKLAIEFRHPDWFKGDNFEQIAQIMENYQAGTVMTDVAGRRDVLHMRPTTPTVMLRFVGNDLHPTDFERVDVWVQRFKNWLDKGLEEIYFFAHEPNNDDAPQLATYFIREMNTHCGLNLKVPKSYQLPVQGSLF